MYSTVDGASQNGPQSLSFDTSGTMTTTMPFAVQTYITGGGESLSITLDLSGTVQYGRSFSADSMSQNGYRDGSIQASNGVSVGADGTIHASYSNGQSRKVGQVVLANFVNPNALISTGDNQWVENADPVNGTGKVILDTPMGALGMGLGPIQGGVREQSNADLTTELVALIEQQRNYQASAQTLKIQDQVLQNLVNMR
jgi:flagellar hook protein FlgE